MVAFVRYVKDSTSVVAGRSDDRRTDFAPSNAAAVDKQKPLGNLSAVHAVGVDNGCKYLSRELLQYGLVVFRQLFFIGCGNGDRFSFPGSYGQCMWLEVIIASNEAMYYRFLQQLISFFHQWVRLSSNHH